MENRLPEWNSRTGVVLLSAAIIVAVLAYGIPMYEAEGTCYNKQKKCHGLPLDSCYGFSTENVNFVQEQQCDALGNITAECNRIGSKIAEANNDSIGTRWAPMAEVEGFTCEKWNDIYGINLTSY